MALTEKQELYCQKFIETGDKSKSYRYAFSDSDATDKSINELAVRLHNDVKVQARVKELQEIARGIADKKFGITAETMLRHLDILRNARIDEYVNLLSEKVQIGEDDEGEPVYSEQLRVVFKPFDELTKEQLMCIESVKETRYGIELKLHGKEWTIEKINKHIGFYEKDNKQKTPDAPAPTIVFKKFKGKPDE